MNVGAIEKRMSEKGISIIKMSGFLKMHPSTYYRKRQNNGEGFSVPDLMVFKKTLELTNKEAVEFLLNENSQE